MSFFFNIEPLGIHALHLYYSAWIPLVKKLSTADMMSSYELFSPLSQIYIYMCVWGGVIKMRPRRILSKKIKLVS